MKKNIEYKKELLLKINNTINKYKLLILIDPTNIKSFNLTCIRRLSLNNNMNFMLVKNSLLNKSIKETNFYNIIDYLKGPNILILSNEDIIFTVKIINKFIKNNNSFNPIKAISFDNNLFYEDKINYILTLLTYNDAIKKFIYLLNYISINKFFNILLILKKNKIK